MSRYANVLADWCVALFAEENADFEPEEGIEELGCSFPPFRSLSFKDIDQKTANEE